MKYLLILLFIPSFCFAYSAKNIKLNDYKFTRWVRPQLKSITLDYQTLLVILNPEFKDYKMAFNQLSQLKRNSYQIELACKNAQAIDCQSAIEKSVKMINKLYLSTLKPISIDEKEFFNDNKVLPSFNQFNFYTNSLLELQHKYYNAGLILSERKLMSGEIYELKNLLFQVDSNFNLYLLKNSDERFQKDFMAYWSHFIKPVQNLILPQNEKAIFLRYLNDFNIQWNMLGVALTKRNKHISKSAKGLIKTIGNRWNNILKVTLRN